MKINSYSVDSSLNSPKKSKKKPKDDFEESIYAKTIRLYEEMKRKREQKSKQIRTVFLSKNSNKLKYDRDDNKIPKSTMKYYKPYENNSIPLQIYEKKDEITKKPIKFTKNKSTNTRNKKQKSNKPNNDDIMRKTLLREYWQ